MTSRLILLVIGLVAAPVGGVIYHYEKTIDRLEGEHDEELTLAVQWGGGAIERICGTVSLDSVYSMSGGPRAAYYLRSAISRSPNGALPTPSAQKIYLIEDCLPYLVGKLRADAIMKEYKARDERLHEYEVRSYRPRATIPPDQRTDEMNSLKMGSFGYLGREYEAAKEQSWGYFERHALFWLRWFQDDEYPPLF